MKNPKISFLIAAHNEEKIINKTLNNLLHLPYDSYEVIIGLDGCTDKTEEIVKRYCRRSKKFKYYNLNLRQGKPAMINKIIKYAKGEIIIINDADWIFKVKNKKSLNDMLDIFSSAHVGGIADSFPIQYPIKKETSLLETGVILQNLIWMNYVKSKGIKSEGDWIIANDKIPLLVNIFRKKLYKQNKTLGDDFERFFHITSSRFKRGHNTNSCYDVMATNNPNNPRMISIGETFRFKELIKIKERTAIARSQLKKDNKTIKILSINFYLYILKNMLEMNLKELTGFCLLNMIHIYGAIKSKFKKPISTKEGWKMRMSR